MIYFLDSSIVIALLRGKDSAIEFVSSKKKEEIVTSSICVMEVMTGVYRSTDFLKRKKDAETLFESFYNIFDLDREQADIAGRIKSELSKKGSLIDDLDILIGASAISGNAILVTYNPKHFQRIKELKVHSLL